MNSDLVQTIGHERQDQSDPFGSFRRECETALKAGYSSLKKTSGQSFPSLDIGSTLEDPPNPTFGHLASSLSFELAKIQKKRPIEVAKTLAETTKKVAKLDLVESVEATEPGYVNFRANLARLTELTLKSVRQYGSEYGLLKTHAPERTVVEHTSANPARPIHIGTAKGAIFGDALARLLAARGHNVRTHFYIDDTGRQVVIMAYGYKLLGEPTPEGKPDHFIGKIYSVTATLVEIEELKKRLVLFKKTNASDTDLVATTKSLDKWVGVAADLQSKYPQEFDRLNKLISKDPDPEKSISDLIRKYEKKDLDTTALVRRVTQIILTGFAETLRRARIRFDQWDWESDLLWTGRVAELVGRLKESGFTFNKGGALELDVAKAVEKFGLRETLGVSPTFEFPPLTLLRSDGTSLYATRDIAYTLYKFENAERVINVIGSEQSLAQFQVKVAFWITGHRKEAEKFIYFPIGHMLLEGQGMSARRGRYVTFDQVLDETLTRAKTEVDRRSPSIPEELRQRTAERIAISAVRYAILSVEAVKATNFVWDKVLNFETNSAAFINYAYTRSSGILRKLGKIAEPKAFNLLTDPVEQALVLELSKLPETFAEAADDLNPTLLCLSANLLAQRFHEFYEKSDISHVSNDELKWERVAIVLAVRTVLKTLAGLLGLELAERM
ncbi:arginine--tRNA ligase [Candidatus Bathyarchaeota archaeon]|nr:MAG: arginine--tRNA ligase [Candidatus Bathyarchaeota archaeon]